MDPKRDDFQNSDEHRLDREAVDLTALENILRITVDKLDNQSNPPELRLLRERYSGQVLTPEIVTELVEAALSGSWPAVLGESSRRSVSSSVAHRLCEDPAASVRLSRFLSSERR